MQPDRDYVLGTHDAELARLGVQHAVWRETVMNCWSRAGIQTGDRVLDVGCGPGYATVDLAELVGHEGEVVAVERSSRFASAARETCQQRGLQQVEVLELDLMENAVPGAPFDAAWCRWVACFVRSPELLAKRIADALRPRGAAVFHEYAAYQTFGPVKRAPLLHEFVERVMHSWRATGGEPNIALDLPEILKANGFQIREMIPRVFCVQPSDPMWAWPAGFIDINLDRMVELGEVESEWATRARAELEALCKDPDAAMLTPLVLEIVAERT